MTGHRRWKCGAAPAAAALATWVAALGGSSAEAAPAAEEQGPAPPPEPNLPPDGEHGGIPHINNNVITSSLVLIE